MQLKVRDNRWQFSFGSKYMVIADVVSNTGDTYTTGGVPISLALDPEVKSSRAPWFASFTSDLGWTACYIPSDLASASPNPPSTTLSNVNQGFLMIFEAGVEMAAGTSLAGLVPGNLQGLFIFQGLI